MLEAIGYFGMGAGAILVIIAIFASIGLLTNQFLFRWRSSDDGIGILTLKGMLGTIIIGIFLMAIRAVYLFGKEIVENFIL